MGLKFKEGCYMNEEVIAKAGEIIAKKLSEETRDIAYYP